MQLSNRPGRILSVDQQRINNVHAVGSEEKKGPETHNPALLLGFSATSVSRNVTQVLVTGSTMS